MIKLFFALLAPILVACAPQVTTHGNFVEAETLKLIEIGTTKKTDIIHHFGQPSFEGAFQSGKIYYNSQRVEKKVAGKSSTVERQLIILSFDAHDILQEVQIKDITNDIDIVKLDSKTPTPGVRLTVIDQIFSNVRRNQTGN